VVQNHLLLKQNYNFSMTCEEYDRLEKDWQDKERASQRVSMGGYGRSIKETLAERDSANTQRINAETLWMNHIKFCAVCQSEGKKTWEVYTHPPNF
jgi:RNA polymerase-binding transcription factor DksA